MYHLKVFVRLVWKEKCLARKRIRQPALCGKIAVVKVRDFQTPQFREGFFRRICFRKRFKNQCDPSGCNFDAS